MDYNVIAFENSKAIGMCISGKIQYIYIYIDREIKQLYLLLMPSHLH